MRNIKLTIEYDGTNYVGWQRQKNGMSIEETIEKAIKGITSDEVRIIGSSRTDAGVHAKGQTANFFTASKIPGMKFSSAINSKLPNDIVILDSLEVNEDFHSRYSSLGKKYSYRILNRKQPPAYLRNFVEHCPYELNYTFMVSASKAFLGSHDFTAFKSTGSSAKTSVRTIKYIELTRNEDLITLNIEGDGFLYNMVRIIAGTLIDVGRGKIPYDSIPDIIDSRDRNRSGKTAGASGLCLEKVYY
jgi:tRNA pseudouridine38-40 synthase